MQLTSLSAVNRAAEIIVGKEKQGVGVENGGRRVRGGRRRRGVEGAFTKSWCSGVCTMLFAQVRKTG